MKKFYLFLFCIFSFVLFNSNILALHENKVNVSISLDDNTHFNIFWELNNNTKLAQELAAHGQNFKSYLLDLYTSNEVNDYSDYAIWLDYCPIDIEINDCHYKISMDINDGWNDNITYYFDENMNLLDHIFNHNGAPFNTGWYGLDQDNTNIFFQYYEGTFEYKFNYNHPFRYVLKNVEVDGKSYRIEGDETSWLEKLWNGLFKSYYNYDEQEIDLEWYANNTIMSQNIALTPVHDTIFNFQDLDMDSNYYDSVYINEYKDGVVLVPKTTTYDINNQDFMFYAFMETTDNYLKGGIVPFNNGVADVSNINYIYNANFGKMKLRPIAFSTFGAGDMTGSDNPLTSHWYDFAYYFYTDDTAHDIKLFYNRYTYDLVYVNNGSVSVVDPLTSTSSSFNIRQTRMISDDIISTSDYHLGAFESKYPTGIPTSYIDNGGDKVHYGGADTNSSMFDSSNALENGKNMLVSIKNAISGLSSIISTFFESFPEFSNLFKFALTCAVIIGILKLVF